MTKKKPQAKGGKAKTPTPGQRMLVPRSMKSQISALDECEAIYLKAVLDPFDPSLRGRVCYPSFPSRDSVKYNTTWAGTVTIGTNGLGFLMVDPTYANDVISVWYTGGSYAGTTSSAFSKSDAGVSNSTMSGPYASALFQSFNSAGSSNEARVVTGGIRTKYTGTELNRGGLNAYLLDQSQDSLVNNTTLGASFGLTYSNKFPTLGDEWQHFVIPPFHEVDLEYNGSTNLFPWSQNRGTTANPFIGVVFNGTAGNTFWVELIFHCEVAGASVQLAAATPSHIGNQQLIQSVMSASASAVYRPDSEKTSSIGILSRLRNIATNPLVKTAVNLGTAYLQMRMGRPPSSVMRVASTRGAQAIQWVD